MWCVCVCVCVGHYSEKNFTYLVSLDLHKRIGDTIFNGWSTFGCILQSLRKCDDLPISLIRFNSISNHFPISDIICRMTLRSDIWSTSCEIGLKWVPDFHHGCVRFWFTHVIDPVAVKQAWKMLVTVPHVSPKKQWHNHNKWGTKTVYRKISDIRRTKSQSSNAFCLGLQFSLCNILKPCVKWKMKM